MDSRERVYRALRFEKPDRVPRDLWAVPAIAMFRPGELAEVLNRFPCDIVLPVDTAGTAMSASGALGSDRSRGDLLFSYGRAERASGTPFIRGSYTDEWDCEWQVGEDGIVGEVKHPPLEDWSALDQLTPPWEVLDDANWDVVNRICAQTDKFVLTPWHIDPFERMQFLRGTEALLMDLAYGTAEILKLREMVREFNLREIELWCKTEVDAIRIADDWGSQTSLLISPDMWREYFKPLYSEYCQLIRSAGKFVFFHSDGHISSILPELIEMGVNALNAQLFCMDIEELSRKYGGQITFWGELDRQWVLPYGGPQDVREAVHRVRRAFDSGEGGLIAQLEWGKYVPRENVGAAYEAWLESRPMK